MAHCELPVQRDPPVYLEQLDVERLVVAVGLESDPDRQVRELGAFHTARLLTASVDQRLYVGGVVDELRAAWCAAKIAHWHDLLRDAGDVWPPLQDSLSTGQQPVHG